MIICIKIKIILQEMARMSAKCMINAMYDNFSMAAAYWHNMADCKHALEWPAIHCYNNSLQYTGNLCFSF